MADVDDLELDDEDFAAIRAQLRAAWTRRGGRSDDMPDALSFAESDLPDSCFAYVPDDAKGADGAKSKRKLRLCTMDGDLDSGIVGAAKAALGKGFRGNRVQLPAGEREQAIRKVNAAAKKLDLEPFEGSEFSALESEPIFSFADPQHSGLLVAFWLDEEAATALAVPGGESADSLHVTLSYCGDVADLGELVVARAVAAIDREVRWRSTLVGKVGGYGRFLASDTSDGQDVFYAAVDVPWLAELRQSISAALIESECVPSMRHGYTPHITLAYLSPDADNPVERLPATELRFGAVTVLAGNRRIDIPLTQNAAMFAIRDDGATSKLHVYQPVELAEPPEWSPFLPTPGRYDHPVYGELDFSPDTYARIIDNFKSGIYQERIPVNAEHDPHAAGAIGWITDMRLTDAGSIEARVEWNERGTALIEDDRYRYVSAEVMPYWNDPVEPDKEYRDVAVGLALTTHPYFKERVLPPLAASEAVLTRHAGDPGKEAGMSEENAQQHETPPAAKQAVTEEASVTQEQSHAPGNLSAAQLNEKAVAEFRALKADFAKTQAIVAKLSEENTALKKDTVLKWATDEVRGRSDENGVPWIGDIAGHVTLLGDLAASFGKDSVQVTQYVTTNRAHAEQIKASDLFREFGTGRSPEGSGQARIDAAVEALMASDTTVTRAQATTRVLSERPELYDEYQRERR